MLKLFYRYYNNAFFSLRLLLVLRGHSVFSSPPQRPMTSDFEGFSIPDVIHYIYFPFKQKNKKTAPSIIIHASCCCLFEVVHFVIHALQLLTDLEQQTTY